MRLSKIEPANPQRDRVPINWVNCNRGAVEAIAHAPQNAAKSPMPETTPLLPPSDFSIVVIRKKFLPNLEPISVAQVSALAAAKPAIEATRNSDPGRQM